MKNLINDKENYIFFILAIFCLIKISLIQSIPILNDEAYALTISKKLSLSYFDHPPLTMWILYFFSARFMAHWEHATKLFEINL